MQKLFKTKFGSHLYGTNTPTSDLDYKGVYMEDLENIVLKKDKDTIFENTNSKNESGRNNPDAIDCEWIELRRFIKDALDGQTYALDMLFAPDSLWELTSDTWNSLLLNYKKLLSKDVAPYIGYCRHQANKYGLKGSRLGELLRVIEWAKKLPPNDTIEQHLSELKLSEFVEIINTTYNNTGRELTQTFLSVLERKFEIRTKVKDILQPLQLLNDKYGNRAVEAMNNEGIDWKAVSHAFRCMFQLKELALTGFIKFPLKDADYLKDIKQGKISWDVLNGDLYTLMEETIKIVEQSSILPDKPDKEFWNEWLIKQYLK